MLGKFFLVKVLRVSAVFTGEENQNRFSNHKKVKIEIKIYLAV